MPPGQGQNIQLARGTGANGSGKYKLASHPDCSFAGPLGGVGPVCGPDFFPNPIPIPARVCPKPDSFDYLNYPAQTSPKRPISVYVVRSGSV